MYLRIRSLLHLSCVAKHRLPELSLFFRPSSVKRTDGHFIDIARWPRYFMRMPWLTPQFPVSLNTRHCHLQVCVVALARHRQNGITVTGFGTGAATLNVSSCCENSGGKYVNPHLQSQIIGQA